MRFVLTNNLRIVICKSVKATLSGQVTDSNPDTWVESLEYLHNAHRDLVTRWNCSHQEAPRNISGYEIKNEWTGAKLLKLGTRKWVPKLHH